METRVRDSKICGVSGVARCNYATNNYHAAKRRSFLTEGYNSCSFITLTVYRKTFGADGNSSNLISLAPTYLNESGITSGVIMISIALAATKTTSFFSRCLSRQARLFLTCSCHAKALLLGTLQFNWRHFDFRCRSSVEVYHYRYLIRTRLPVVYLIIWVLS